MRFNDTITVYNVIPQHGREPERLQRTVVNGVFWDSTYGAAFSKRGKEEQDSVMVMVPDSPRCMPYGKWFDADCPTDKFTLRTGDIVLRGEHGDAASAAEACGLNAEHFVITSVRDCRYGSKHMWHWEVTGK